MYTMLTCAMAVAQVSPESSIVCSGVKEYSVNSSSSIALASF